MVASPYRVSIVQELRGAPEPTLEQQLARMSPADLTLTEFVLNNAQTLVVEDVNPAFYEERHITKSISAASLMALPLAATVHHDDEAPQLPPESVEVIRRDVINHAALDKIRALSRDRGDDRTLQLVDGGAAHPFSRISRALSRCQSRSASHGPSPHSTVSLGTPSQSVNSKY